MRVRLILFRQTMKILAFPLLLMVTVSCATHRHGREMPLTDAERASLTCEQLVVEIAKTEAFLAQVKQGAPGGAAFLAFLGDFGIGNDMERRAALESGERRLFDLQEQRYAKGCPSAVKPVPRAKPVATTHTADF